jgi:hypothetical protein
MRSMVAAGVGLLIAWCCATPSLGQTEGSGESASGSEASAAANANNPLADIRAFNLHNYYIPELSGVDESANTFWARYAQPFGKWLFRGSLPVSRVPTGSDSSTSGLGDLNAFAAYLFDTGDPAVSFGVGPQLTMPTATEDETGTGRWQAGAAMVYFNGKSQRFQWGGLVTWQTDFAGDDDRSGTNLLALQPFYFLQLGKGLYLRGAPIAVFNLENDTYHVPVGLGIGQVIPTESVVYNVFVEPQFTILDRGAGQPELQLFVGLNMQFLGS